MQFGLDNVQNEKNASVSETAALQTTQEWNNNCMATSGSVAILAQAKYVLARANYVRNSAICF